MAITSITLTGTFKNPDTTAAYGWITFTPTSEFLQSGGTVVPMVPKTVPIFAGALSVVLYANDDPSTQPLGQGYTVTEIFGEEPNVYTIIIPSGSGSTIDISTLTHIGQVPQAVYNYTVAFDAFFEAAVRANRPEQLATPLANLNMGGNRILGVGNGVSVTDAANLGQAGGAWVDQSNFGWTRVSATQFTVSAGFDLTIYGFYVKGMPLKWADSGGANKYGAVQSTSYSSGTNTVNMIPTTDYSIAAGAITSPCIGFGQPPLFPTHFAWAPAVSGASFGTNASSWTVLGGIVVLTFAQLTNGTGSSNAYTVTAPIGPGSTHATGVGTAVDAGAAVHAAVQIIGTTITLYKTSFAAGNASAWTPSGARAADFTLTFPI